MYKKAQTFMDHYQAYSGALMNKPDIEKGNKSMFCTLTNSHHAKLCLGKTHIHACNVPNVLQNFSTYQSS